MSTQHINRAIPFSQEFKDRPSFAKIHDSLMFESYFGIGDVSLQPIMTEEEYSRMLNTAMSLEDYQGVRILKVTFLAQELTSPFISGRENYLCNTYAIVETSFFRHHEKYLHCLTFQYILVFF